MMSRGFVLMYGQLIGDEYIKSLVFNFCWSDRQHAEDARSEFIRNSEKKYNYLTVTVETLSMVG
jgi:hypothetical protein